jgi:hypothetical protein
MDGRYNKIADMKMMKKNGYNPEYVLISIIVDFTN